MQSTADSAQHAQSSCCKSRSRYIFWSSRPMDDLESCQHDFIARDVRGTGKHFPIEFHMIPRHQATILSYSKRIRPFMKLQYVSYDGLGNMSTKKVFQGHDSVEKRKVQCVACSNGKGKIFWSVCQSLGLFAAKQDSWFPGPWIFPPRQDLGGESQETSCITSWLHHGLVGGL